MFEIDDVVKNICKESFQRFIGTGVYVGLFFMSILYIIIGLKKEDSKEKKIKIAIGVYSIIVLLLNTNPIFTKFLIKILGEQDTYWRVYWLVPIGIAIAYMFTEIIFMQDKNKNKILSFILIAFIITLSGDFMYNSDNFTKVSNYYKIPDTVLDIIWHISEDDEDYKKIAGQEVFSIYTRQIDGNILVSQARNISGTYSDNSIISYIGNEDIENICKYCVENKCNYLVLNTVTNLDESYRKKYDIEMLYSNEEYALYKLKNITE